MLGKILVSILFFGGSSLAFGDTTVSIRNASCNRYLPEMKSYLPVGCSLEASDSLWFTTSSESVAANPRATYTPGTGHAIPSFSVYVAGAYRGKYNPASESELLAFYSLVANAKRFEEKGRDACSFDLTYQASTGRLIDSKLSCK